MVKLPEFDPIHYLVLRKYGLPVERFGWTRIAEAEEYQKKLDNLSDDELRALVEEEQALEARERQERKEAEERERFFNRPEAMVDVEFWSTLAIWRLHEAVALSFGRDPDRVDLASVEPYRNASPFARQYCQLSERVRRAALDMQLPDPVAPRDFLAWAKRSGVGIPEALEQAIGRNTSETTDLQADLGEASERAYKDEQAEKLPQRTTDTSTKRGLLHPKERDSLLKLVIGMAMGGYSYDPRSSRSDIVGEIESDLDNLGVHLDADTIRKYLRQGAELLPGGETEQKRR